MANGLEPSRPKRGPQVNPRSMVRSPLNPSVDQRPRFGSIGVVDQDHQTVAMLVFALHITGHTKYAIQTSRLQMGPARGMAPFQCPVDSGNGQGRDQLGAVGRLPSVLQQLGESPRTHSIVSAQSRALLREGLRRSESCLPPLAQDLCGSHV